MKYGIGLDIGISSVGFAVVALDAEEAPCGILQMGSRIFDKAEQPKTGESLAAPRRAARGLRRRLRRHRHRLERIRSLLVAQGLISEAQLDALFHGKLEDIYALRTRALDEAVQEEEFARILIHLAQRRGFKSNRKSDAADKEQGKLLKAVQENKLRIENAGYRTVGEMFYKSPDFAVCKRNKSEQYLATVHRDMIKEEACLLFEAQRKFGKLFANPNFQDAYLAILLSQRSFDEGPGGNSPYGGNMIEQMVGFCTFEKEEKRAAKATFSFEYFTLLQKVNQIVIQCDGKNLPLTKQERDAVISLALKSPDVSYGKIRGVLQSMPENARFNMVHYRADKTVPEAEKQKLNVCRAYHEMRKALDKVKKGRIGELSHEQRDIIGKAFSLYKTDDKIISALEEANLTSFEIDALLHMSTTPFVKFGHLSLTVCRKMIPFLEQGMRYHEACEAAGYDFKAHAGDEKSFTLPAKTDEMDNMTNPVVRRAVSQSIKVINAIIRTQKSSPLYINIELARELSKDFKERKELEKAMKENADNNEKIMLELRGSLGQLSPTGQDLIKYRLWKEQDGRCAYSLKTIPIETLFDAGSAEIDHIIPYSMSFDDSRSNKVLVRAEENRLKGNRLPLQYLQGKTKEAFIVYTQNTVKQYRKRKNLLKEAISDDDLTLFKERNLTDTKYIARFLYNFISDTLLFSPSTQGRKRHVTAVNGGVTSHLRKRWGLSKVRADGDLHHAVDALVIACATQGMINEISRFYSYVEQKYIVHEDGVHTVNPKTGVAFPLPWPHFRDDIEIRLTDTPGEALCELQKRGKLPSYNMIDGIELADVRPIFVSRAPKRKVTGAAHKETIKAKMPDEDGYVTVKRPLTSLKLTQEGEIADYFMPASDTLLYEALKKQLQQFGGNADKAFAQPFYKPKRNGERGPLVKKVKLYEKATLSVPVQQNTAVADNDSMVRVDVFLVPNDGYYFVPIYVADTIKPVLPNKAVVAFASANDWKEMQPEHFIFSLFAGDLMYVESKRKLKLTNLNKESTRPKAIETPSSFLYFVGADISVASFVSTNHDRSYGISGMGIKTLKKLEKYQVDVLGNLFKVNKEPRQTFK